MNGYDWKLEAACTTDGTKSSFTGPAELARHEMVRWLEEHDRHEFTFTQTIIRPADEDPATPQVPEFMRTVPVD